jgi:O-antigen ligase
MFQRTFGSRFHDQLHLFGACSFAVGLSTSKIVLSLSMLLLVLNLLLEGDFKKYKINLRQNSLLLPLLIYFALHLLALIWTSNYLYAFGDLKTKLTLLIIPLVFVVKPINFGRQLQWVTHFFMFGLVVTSAINFLAYYQFFGNKTYTDIRELSLFGSHIRYGILIAMGAAICLYELNRSSSKWKIILGVCLLWFCYYTYFSQIISGVLALTSVFISSLIFWIHLRSKLVAGIVAGTLLLGTVLFIILLIYPINKPTTELDESSLPLKTNNGNAYSHNLLPETFNDGKPVLANLCEIELESEWEKKSEFGYYGKDLKGQPIRFTLMRYMTAKDLKKDSLDFQALTLKDIKSIEKGIASPQESESGLWARWKGIQFQLQNAEDPNGHSLLQRLEYWKTAWHIIEENWLLGVGTGDVQDAFDKQYSIDKSPLQLEYRLRAHNNYLTSWLSFGLLGLISFLVMVFYFLNFQWKNQHYLPFVFMLVAIVTFVLEDTLETQTGVSFFAFFYGLYIKPKN